MRLSRPQADGDFWHRAWVNAVSIFSKRFPPSFRISQDVGPGLIFTGTREWRNYTASCDLTLTQGKYGGLVFRA